MKKILLGILLTSFLAYGSDPLIAKRLEQNVRQCYKQSQEVYQSANQVLGVIFNFGILGEYAKTWEWYARFIASADKMRTAMLKHCDKEVRDVLLQADIPETLDLLNEFTDYIY